MSLILSGVVEWELVEVDGLLAGLAAAGPALEDRLQQPHGLLEGESVNGAKVGATAQGSGTRARR
jgi:hypothetical protein